MILARFLGSIVAVLCFCFVVTASAAPRKPVKRPAASAAKRAPAPVKPLPAKPADAPSPTPAPGDVVLYSGRPATTDGLTLTAFGGGTVEDSTEQSFTKGHSLKITTLDSYQGAKLVFGTPPALGDLTDKTRYLALTLRLSATGVSADQSMAGPGFQGDPGQYPGGFAPGGGQYAVAPSVQNIHLILTLANGVKTDVLRPLPSTGEAQTGVDQWVNVAVPLSALGFGPGTVSPLQSLVVAGDDYAVMYLGQIRLSQDDSVLTCFAGDQQTVAVGQPFLLKATASGGLSALHYAWTLDAASGTPEQAAGPLVTTQYLKTGDHTVTLTVSDVDGIKAPVTSTTIIHVQ